MASLLLPPTGRAFPFPLLVLPRWQHTLSKLKKVQVNKTGDLKTKWTQLILWSVNLLWEKIARINEYLFWLLGYGHFLLLYDDIKCILWFHLHFLRNRQWFYKTVWQNFKSRINLRCPFTDNPPPPKVLPIFLKICLLAFHDTTYLIEQVFWREVFIFSQYLLIFLLLFKKQQIPKI